MRLITFLDGQSRQRLGAWVNRDQQVVDLRIAFQLDTGVDAPALHSMQALIEAGERAWDTARRLIERAPEEALLATRNVRLLAPLPVPIQMRDFMVFEQHASNSGARQLPEVWYQQPIYYKCNRFAVQGTDADVKWPKYSEIIDYELELAIVIGKQGVDIPAARADQHIFGYTIFNDFSARDAQRREMASMLGPAKGKDFDGADCIGPCIVTPDEVDPKNLTMLARVNGEEWSRGNSGTMHHSFADMIAHVSQDETIYPGEIMGSGTVGRGCGSELGRFLKKGDVVELEISGIGVLRNRVV